jgi:hypothetical protein
MKHLATLPVTSRPGVTLAQVNSAVDAYNAASKRAMRYLRDAECLNLATVAKLSSLESDCDTRFDAVRALIG